MHRAQYVNITDGERRSGLEKVINYGQTKLASEANTGSSLFGDLPTAMDVPKPKIAPCAEWTLTEKLDHEKDVTGMFMSGHPLDHYRFELRHYGIMNLGDFNEIKESLTLSQNNAGKNFKLAGLVTGAQHRTTKTGKNFGILAVEDYTGKTELALFGEDYQRYKQYLDLGRSILVNGTFKAPWKEGASYEFKVSGISLLETAKQTLTKNVEISLNATALSKQFVEFITRNIKSNPGKATLRFNVYEPEEDLKVSLFSSDKGFAMNDDMAEFLMDNLDVEVSVVLA